MVGFRIGPPSERGSSASTPRRLPLCSGWTAGSGFLNPEAASTRRKRWAALGEVAADLARRAAALAADPEVARSMQGGGIAVRRQALFTAARDAMTGADPGTWIALADRRGEVHAWWGEAPDRVTESRPPATLSAGWSATRLELLHWQVVGSGPFAGLICAARSLPVEAPGFGRALELRGDAVEWEPVAPGAGAPLLRLPGGQTLVAGRRAALRVGADARDRIAVLVLLLVVSLWLLAGRTSSTSTGIGLAIAILAASAYGSGVSPHALMEPTVLIPALGVGILPEAADRLRRRVANARNLRSGLAGYALLALAFFATRRVALPDLGVPLPIWSPTFLALLGLTALVASALALGAASASSEATRGRTGFALGVTAAAVVLGLKFVSAEPTFPVAVAVAAVLSYELCRRAIAAAPPSAAPGPFRLIAAAILLFVLIASPWHEHERAAAAFRSASAIRLPEPETLSAGAVVAARRAVEGVERFDLARELPAPVSSLDLSDLAYRLWHEGQTEAPSSALIAYEVFDPMGLLRSRFSLIPATEDTTNTQGIRIERHEVAVVRRPAVLRNDGAPWGRAVVSVADWPSWDPLPPRLEVYRRLVGAEPSPASPPRPVLASYGPDGSKREEGPDFAPEVFASVRESGKPMRVRLRYRGEELRGELRPLSDGFELVAIPGPDFLQRLLTAALLLPPAAGLYAAGGLLLLWRFVTSRGRIRDLVPRGARTFRGRLIALFVLSVMIPLLAVTAFLRSSIAARTGQDTLDHARTGLETARRVLDDYLPSAAAQGRLNLLDDSLLSWLANAVGYDLSVFSPEAKLVATSAAISTRPASFRNACPGRHTPRSGSAARANAPTRGSWRAAPSRR